MSNTDNVRSVMTDYPHNWHDEDFDDWLNEIKREGWVDAKRNPEDFLAAVETELNGIFISRDDLPEVWSEGEFFTAATNGIANYLTTDVNTVSLRKHAYATLALAEYAKKNPPVDQKQVDSLVDIIVTTTGAHKDDVAEIARKILASGKVSVTVND